MITNFVFICLLFNIINALNWCPSGNVTNQQSVISLQWQSSGIEIDAHRNDQIIILKDTNDYNSNITIYCFITGYSDNSDITFSFCEQGKDKCIESKDGSDPKKITFSDLTISIKTKFLNRKGIQLEFLLPKMNKDLSGSFYCKAVDNTVHFSIRSNNIQIRDKMYWEQNSVTNSDNLKSTEIPLVRKQDLPITFPCLNAGLSMNPALPKWFFQEFSSPVLWVICPVKKGENLPALDKVTFYKCVKFTSTIWTEPDHTLKPILIHDMPWEYYVNDKGELTIFDIRPQFQSELLTFALMCYRKGSNSIIPINTFVKEYYYDYITKGVVFDLSTPTVPVQLKPISPVVQYVDIFARTIPSGFLKEKMPRVAIFAKYFCPPRARTDWFHNGISLSEGKIKKDNFRIQFTEDITFDMAGNYSLIITDNTERLMMTIIVTVIGSPMLVNSHCLPNVKYVWENDSMSFICSYENKPKEMKVLINKHEIELKVSKVYNSSTINLGQTYAYLNALDFDIRLTTDKSSGIVTMNYTVSKLRKSQGQKKFQDHSITFFARNDYGSSVISSSIYVVPNIKEQIKMFPEDYNCIINCMSTVTHEFKCRFNADEYKSKELEVEHYWSVNSNRLEQRDNPDNLFAPYFEIDEKKKDLKLMPISSNNSEKNDFVKKHLKSNFIVCNIKLISTAESKPDFSYISLDDKLLNYKLRSEITLDSNPTNTALICGIIVGLLVLLIIIIIIVILYQRNRSFGETYQLEKLEQKHGINREKEVEDETFQPYQNDGDHLDKVSINSDNIDNPYHQEQSLLNN